MENAITIGSIRPYRFVMDLPVQDRHFNHNHLDAAATAELLLAARSTYFREGVGWPGLGPAFWLVYRNLTIDYLSEAFLGEQLRCGVMAVSRSRRTIVLNQLIWEASSERPIAAGRVADVAFDVQSRQAVDLPEDLWDAVQRFEQGPLES